jgi:thiol-disulfide isomerase/thioredoxin
MNRLNRQLLIGLITLLPLVAVAAPAAVMAGVGPGIQAPEAAGIVLNGPANSKVSTLRGRVLIVEFWASWCGPCIESMPRLDALRKEVQAAGYTEQFEILAVGLDKNVADARRFLGIHPVSYPVVVDTLGIASLGYGVWRLPATFLIEPSGQVNQIYHGYGETFGPDLRARVFAMLRSQPKAKLVAKSSQASGSAGNP